MQKLYNVFVPKNLFIAIVLLCTDKCQKMCSIKNLSVLIVQAIKLWIHRPQSVTVQLNETIFFFLQFFQLNLMYVHIAETYEMLQSNRNSRIQSFYVWIRLEWLHLKERFRHNPTAISKNDFVNKPSCDSYCNLMCLKKCLICIAIGFILTILIFFLFLLYINTFLIDNDLMINVSPIIGQVALSAAQRHVTSMMIAGNVDEKGPLVLVGMGSLKAGTTYFNDLLVSMNDYGPYYRPDLINFEESINKVENTFWWSFDSIVNIKSNYNGLQHGNANGDANTNGKNGNVNSDSKKDVMSKDILKSIRGANGIMFIESWLDGELHYWDWCSKIFSVPFVETVGKYTQPRLRRKGQFLSKENIDENRRKSMTCDYDDYLKRYWYWGGDMELININSNLHDVGKINNNNIYNNKSNLHYSLMHNKSDLSRIVLTEKTPAYMQSPESGMVLMYYATVKPIKFYIIVRDPIQRVLSNYYYTCITWDNTPHTKDRFGSKTDLKSVKNTKNAINTCNNNQESVSNMKQHLKNLEIDNIYYSTMFNKLNDYKSLMYYNNTINNDFDKTIIENFINGFYQFNSIQEKNNKFSVSCYYPQIRILYEFFYWNLKQQSSKYNIYSDNNNKKFDFSKTLKIFSYEQLEKNASNIVWKLKCWLAQESNSQFKSNHNKLSCNNQYRNIPKHFTPMRDNHISITSLTKHDQDKLTSTSEKQTQTQTTNGDNENENENDENVNQANLNLRDYILQNDIKLLQQMEQLFKGCNTKLYQFLQHNKDVMLDDSDGVKLWDY